jgi:carbon storage regulator
MLILSRKNEESIMINGNIKITILSGADSRIKLCIDAPQSISVDRLEVHTKREQTMRSIVLNQHSV